MLFGERRLVRRHLRRDTRIERVHADIQPLVLRNLPIRLDGVHLGQRLGLFDDAPAEQEQHCQGHAACEGPAAACQCHTARRATHKRAGAPI